MNPTAKRWIIWACIGMCLPAAIYSARAYRHRNDRYLPVAQMLGVDVGKWADLQRTLDRASAQHTLSSWDLDQVAAWSKDGSKHVRILAVGTLRACTDAAVAPRVFALARPCMHDSDPGVRLKAVNLLKKLRDPNLRADLAPMITDPDPNVRDSALQAIGSSATGPGVASGR